MAYSWFGLVKQGWELAVGGGADGTLKSQATRRRNALAAAGQGPRMGPKQRKAAILRLASGGRLWELIHFSKRIIDLAAVLSSAYILVKH